MKWDKFNETEKLLPEEILSEYIQGFEAATDYRLNLEIRKKSMSSRFIKLDFKFDLNLTSKSLLKYSFEVLEIGYDPQIYPLKIGLEHSIFKEVVGRDPAFIDYIDITDEKHFRKTLNDVFKSNRFVEVVEGLMKLSKLDKSEW